MKDLPKVFDVTVQVTKEEMPAFQAMLREFQTGQTAHHREVRARAADREQGIASLHHLFKVAQRDSGQCGRVARFLLGLYNGMRFPFDLTDLRTLDDELFEHCMAVLRLDGRQTQQEVHRYFENGGEKWEQMARSWAVPDVALLRNAAKDLAQSVGFSGLNADKAVAVLEALEGKHPSLAAA